MKKTIVIVSIMTLCILLVICVSLGKKQGNIIAVQKENAEYEQYKEKQIYGTEVVSIINKAMNHNLKQEIKQDEKGFFVPNKTNSIKIEINLFNGDKLKTYQMENIQKIGISGFVQNFNLILFKCTKIEYHEQTKRVAKLVFEQIEK